VKYLDDTAVRMVEYILDKGNNAEIRRKGKGVVVVEVKKEIKFTSGELTLGKSNRS